jgi:nicotinamidase-related amidase
VLNEKEKQGGRVEYVRKVSSLCRLPFLPFPRATVDLLSNVPLSDLQGTCKHIDAYSAFSDVGRSSFLGSDGLVRLTVFPTAHPSLQNNYSHFTPLARLLFENRITHLTIVGLALDYCVRYTVLDARKFGFEVEVWRAGTKAVDGASEEKVLGEFRRKEVAVGN